MPEEPALRVRDLRVEVAAPELAIVDEVSFDLRRGEVLGLVGESGCGKTSVAMALLNHARPGTRIAYGRVVLGDIDLLSLPRRSVRPLRGDRISYVPQDPSASLNPRKRVGDQINESLRIHGRDLKTERGRIDSLLDAVRLPATREFLRRFPHQLSGGQQQRILLTMALGCSPDVVVLDEPTTGLDVTTQSHVLEAIANLRQMSGSSFLYVTHDLAVLANLADRIGVMYAGRLVESGVSSTILSAPAHPYTARLIASTPSIYDPTLRQGISGTAPSPEAKPSGCSFAPRCHLAEPRCREAFPADEQVAESHTVRCFRWRKSITRHMTEAATRARRAGSRTVLEVQDLTAGYGKGGNQKAVVHTISLAITDGECVGVVGESGSGKSTLARSIAGLHPYDQGVIKLDGTTLEPDVRNRTADERRGLQLVFQNPDRSLNPRRTVADQIGRPLKLFGLAQTGSPRHEIEDLLKRVRLPLALAKRFPSELSGGEKQRVAIARALAARPRVLLCDEVTSALDVSVQAVILSLLDELRRESALAILLISHDLGVVNSITDRVLVLQNGVVCEQGVTSELLHTPGNKYTRELIAASPELPSAR